MNDKNENMRGKWELKGQSLGLPITPALLYILVLSISMGAYSLANRGVCQRSQSCIVTRPS